MRESGRPAVPLTITGPAGVGGIPVTCGVPFPNGTLGDADRLRLAAPDGSPVPLQSSVTGRHSDGSVRWVLLDFLTMPAAGPEACYELTWEETPRSDSAEARVSATEEHAFLSDRELAADLRLELADRGQVHSRQVGPFETAAGMVRDTGTTATRFDLGRRRSLTADVRLCRWRAAGLARLTVRLHNPARARHPGGLWDLGDPGSVVFESFGGVLNAGPTRRTEWRIEPAADVVTVEGAAELRQADGGTVTFRHAGGETTAAGRGNPVVVLDGDRRTAVAVREFWQNFPKAITVEAGGWVRVGLFPAGSEGGHELQGGESRTHVIWFDLAPAGDRPHEFVHEPPRVVLPAEWWERCGVFECFGAAGGGHSVFRELTAAALDPETGLDAKKAIGGEYGWRNWGELWADHEQAHRLDPEPRPPRPIVSHYNNQYDVLEGLIRNYARTGDPRWWNLADPLARHVVDVDLYRTDRDRAAYNGGLFWHTDHYRDAATSTHRTYSRGNAIPGAAYGGGPGSSHCYATGLLHYWCLTGDPAARDAVTGLADWLIAMEDGRRTVFGLIDDGPTGLSSESGFDGYHGPGRGPGNAVTTLVDAWELTGDAKYRDQAEALIRRVIRPDDDFAALRLDDAENRWFYVVFLHALCRHLDAKLAAGENDPMYAYGVACLRHYAGWMADHERPWLDRPERLEYLTETWAAQEVRKANAMRRAAKFCPEPLRTRLLGRGRELADRGWSDLARFETRTTLRPVAIVLIEGLRDAFFRSHSEPPAPEPAAPCPPPDPPFVPQKQRVKRLLRSPLGLATASMRAADLRRWPSLIDALRRRT